MVLENALCFTDEAKRKVDPKPTDRSEAQIERAESLFFDEVPPNDGHRKNILKPAHTKVGIGVAQSTETAKELAVPCFAQEFVDSYGSVRAAAANGEGRHHGARRGNARKRCAADRRRRRSHRVAEADRRRAS